MMRNHVRDFLSLLVEIDFRKVVDCSASDKEVARKNILAGYAVVINVPEPDGKAHDAFRAIYTIALVLYHGRDRLLGCCRRELDTT